MAITLVASSMVAAPKKDVRLKNPFMAEYKTKYKIPPFANIGYQHYLPAVEAGIEQQNQEIKDIIGNPAAPNFDNTVLAPDNCGATLNRVSYVFYALSESDNTPEMQKLAEKISPMLTAQNDEI